MSDETKLANRQDANPMARIKNYMLSPEVKARFTDMMGQNAIYYLNQVMIVVANNTELQRCEPSSVFISAMRAASLRLSVDPAQGQAWIIPYNGKATFQLGYKGVYELALRTHLYRFINVIDIFEGEWLEENRYTGLHIIKGMPKKSEDGKPPKVIARMLYFELNDGYKKTFPMTIEQIAAHAQHYSQGYKNPKSKWHDPQERPKMEMKTVLVNGLRRWGRFNQEDVDLINEIEGDQGGYMDRMGGAPSEWEVTDPGPDTSVNGKAYQDMSEAELLGDLAGEKPATKVDAPTEQPKTEAPAEPQKSEISDLRYQPEALKTYLSSEAKKSRGAFKASGKGLIVQTLEAALGTPDPEAARKQVQVYLTGHPSLTELNDGWLWSLYTWLKPRKSQDGSGEYICDDMAAREARAALNACQPPQDKLF